ncbi:DeoR/GlpR family DNA-binding transcription regulator [Mesorhizobium sp. ESP6-5]|uniref:Transcriptional regulator of sugar metabolism n=1 Tax=Mesorhizobium australicum (strain HAMBI 3006 / LMG 24608 / WSM2073) TaxID=754035 RepID=L0KHL1_MESAW|nr:MULTISPECIES: DeoR/GlpR family DNA-binding transcription regulator [Mesorhizobium]MBZ9932477.1 DeoR/GlpR family DNA-binding transcription regulator [Mesorhizobium sp. BR1-1-5]AGB44015.1 transcriptional regulator of sugar metabolism [Mesorhizobium australicum WSM2073]MBZ9680092.1 DeoR/GlpR family DNA-binding transcription regulator [Mesorhizobium sp. CO1-1-2]MBZ9695522.1 DeoR/GlpR family DNA-binding transcription regulator [Mesorhizobium sp. CO1-1-9]MBZ9727152.1 DeoR/GlpR family DNA-binding 
MSDLGRQRQIVELLRDRPFASVRELQERLGVSAATVRRDIDRIDEAGEARKVYGGISALDGASHAGVAYARPYDENRDLAVEAKRQIAAVAATMVRDGDAVIVHGGSTCFHLGVKLADRNIRLYTNSMPLAAYLSDHGHCSLTVAGGDLHREPGIIHSPTQATSFYASKFFLGTQGLNQEGLLESHPLLVRSIVELSLCADQIVVLADSRKLSIHARNVALPLSRIGTLVTDDGLSDADARMLEDAGVMVRIASTSGALA